MSLLTYYKLHLLCSAALGGSLAQAHVYHSRNITCTNFGLEIIDLEYLFNFLVTVEETKAQRSDRRTLDHIASRKQPDLDSRSLLASASQTLATDFFFSFPSEPPLLFPQNNYLPSLTYQC